MRKEDLTKCNLKSHDTSEGMSTFTTRWDRSKIRLSKKKSVVYDMHLWYKIYDMMQKSHFSFGILLQHNIIIVQVYVERWLYTQSGRRAGIILLVIFSRESINCLFPLDLNLHLQWAIVMSNKFHETHLALLKKNFMRYGTISCHRGLAHDKLIRC